MKRLALTLIVCLAAAPPVRAGDDKPAAGPLSVLDFGARGDGKADDRAAIGRACASGGVVVFPRGTYRVSRSVVVSGADGLLLRGEPGAVVVYPSDDPTVTASGPALSDAMARAAFCLTGTRGVHVEGLAFRGGNSPDLSLNVGPAVYARESEDVHLVRCRNDRGGSLFNQDATPSDRGARLTECVSYGARVNVTVGSDAVVSGCRFEQPVTRDYDRTGARTGSSHAVYVFAGRENVVVSNSTFRNIRTSGVKASGSSKPIRGLVVTGCIFDDCASGVAFGADDVQEHAGCLIAGNLFRDCATNRAGWNAQAAVGVLGARGVVISGNVFDYTRDNLFESGACRGVFAFGAGEDRKQQPLEDVRIAGNVFAVDPKVSPGSVLVAAIEVIQVGVNSDAQGSAVIEGNTIGPCAGQGVAATGNLGLTLRGNTFRGPIVAASLSANRGPVVADNLLIRTATTSSTAQLRLGGDVAPVLRGNIGPWTYSGVKPPAGDH